MYTHSKSQVLLITSRFLFLSFF